MGLDLERERNSIIWIIHSSGSTGLPKLVSISNKAAMARYSFNLETFGLDTLTTAPLYHAYGLSSLFRCFISGKTVQLYSKLPIVRSELIRAVASRQFGLLSAVPFTIKLLSESQDGVEFLKKFAVVTSGGSPMPEELGTLLVSQGVRLISVYGSSETGTLLTSARERGDDDWDWLRPDKKDGHLLIFEPREANTFELYCPPRWPMIADSNQSDGSWRTKDLFIKHPAKDAFHYIGRLDDLIVLENGEKFNPLHVENTIAQDPLIDSCVIFGTSRAATGAAIVLSPCGAKIDQAEQKAVIWLIVQKSQSSLPAYARIGPDMLFILPAEANVPRTDKGTIIRTRFLHLYRDAIDRIYQEQEIGLEKTFYSKADLLVFLSNELRLVLGTPKEIVIPEHEDFASLGVDSLMAAQLRNSVLRNVELRGQKLGLNIVFDHPSIQSLAEEVLRIRDGGVASDTATADEEEAQAMIERYSQFSTFNDTQQPGSCVVLTGATGSLRAHLLAKLIASPAVAIIYCLVRASSNTAAYDRVMESLSDRRLQRILTKFTSAKVICLASDLSDARLGLGGGMFTYIGSSISAVYHCGWAVNFNQRLRSFEKDCIAGVHHLINLCNTPSRSFPARFILFSSISTIMSTSEAVMPERVPLSIAEARCTGYARSKYVAENICERAASTISLPVAILRIGQIVGDTVHGIWNTSEATPLMIRPAKTIGALPALEEQARWIPVDTVAQICIEIGSSAALDTERCPVFNIVNPHALGWTEDLLPLLTGAGLDFKIVAPTKWLALLENSEPDLKSNPTRKLLAHFEEQINGKGETENKDWETKRTAKFSSAFRQVGPPDAHLIALLIKRFETAWR